MEEVESGLSRAHSESGLGMRQERESVWSCMCIVEVLGCTYMTAPPLGTFRAPA